MRQAESIITLTFDWCGGFTNRKPWWNHAPFMPTHTLPRVMAPLRMEGHSRCEVVRATLSDWCSNLLFCGGFLDFHLQSYDLFFSFALGSLRMEGPSRYENGQAPLSDWRSRFSFL